MHASVLSVLLVFLAAEVTFSTLNIPILGNKYIDTEFKYPTDPGAGLRNRGEFARQFGYRGELLVEELGKGHHGPDAEPRPRDHHYHHQPRTRRLVRLLRF